MNPKSPWLRFNYFVLFLHFQVTLRFLLSIYLVSLLKCQKLSLFLFLHNSSFSITSFFKVFICYTVFKTYFPFTIYCKILALFPMVYIFEPILQPIVYNSHSQLLYCSTAPSHSPLVNTSLFSFSVSLLLPVSLTDKKPKLVAHYSWAYSHLWHVFS